MYMRMIVFLNFSASPKVTRTWGFFVLGVEKAFEGVLRIGWYISYFVRGFALGKRSPKCIRSAPISSVGGEAYEPLTFEGGGQ